MKILRNLFPLTLALTVGIFLVGCGDDDDDDNNNNNNPPAQQQLAPTSVAALTDPNAVYTINIAGLGATTLRFPSAGQYQTVINGQTVNGTISNLQRNGNVWTATLTPDPNQQGAQGGPVTLTWTGTNAGTFTLIPQGAAPLSGTFTVTQTQTGGNPGQTNAPPTNNPPANTGISGKTLQLNYAGGGGEKFVFTSNTSASYENGADTATYTYDTTTGQVLITRSGGQTYRLVLAPGSSNGTTTVTYQEPGGQPDVQQANFTLQ